MRVAINLFAIHAYRDRFQLLCCLANHLDELFILTDVLPEDLKDVVRQHSNLTVVEFGRKASVKKAMLWLDNAVHQGRIHLVHDTFGFLASFFQRHADVPGRSFKLLTTSYTSNWAWFNRVRTRDYDLSLTYIRHRISTLWRDRRICQAADKIMVLGPGHEIALIEGHGVNPQAIVWCPAEVDVDRFKPGFTQPHHRPVLSFVGAVCRNKGIDVLFEAAQILVERDIDFELRIIGRILTWERDWFSSLCRTFHLADRLVHLGQLEHNVVSAMYHSTSFCVFPSRFEGSPRSVREALACGVPAILSDIPGHRGLDPDGRFIQFVDEWRGDQWADAIQTLLSESPTENAQRREKGRAHMVAHHSFDAVATRWIQVYESMLSDSN